MGKKAVPGTTLDLWDPESVEGVELQAGGLE